MTEYKVKFEVFEGPLDLLLYLIKKEEVDIYEVNLTKLATQFVEYIELMRILDLEIAGEFLVMAATLIHIKSRMLLPVDEEVLEGGEEDPRFELVQRLLEYQTFKEATSIFREREEQWSKVFSRGASGGESLDATADSGVAEVDHGDREAEEAVPGDLPLFELSVFDLLSAFRKLLEKAPPEVVEITRETLTVKDRISFLLEELERLNAVRFEDLLGGGATRSFLIVTFIALLEILRLGLARAHQDRDFGNIWIVRKQEHLQERP